MFKIICFAGFAPEVVAEIQGAPLARFVGGKDNVLVIKPLKQPHKYTNGNQDYFLNKIVENISKQPASKDIGVGLIYVRRSGEQQAFLKSFFPFSTVVPVEPFFPNVLEKYLRRNAILEYIRQIERVASDLGTRMSLVRDKLSGQNFSPLTLPIRNFKSGRLCAALWRVFSELGTASEPAKILTQACDEIVKLHPLIRGPGPEWHKKKQLFFCDERGLKFGSPGREKHAIARDCPNGHKHSCLISGRVRLGGPIVAGFHYDCSYNRGNVDKIFLNCHGQKVSTVRREYVNIAPNDFIR